MIGNKKKLNYGELEKNSLCGAQYTKATSHIVKELATNSIAQLTRSMNTFHKLCEHAV